MVGRIGRPHGLGGLLAVSVDTDLPDRFSVGARFQSEAGELEIRTVRRHRGALLLAFTGYPDRTAAEGLSGLELFIAGNERRSLGAGEWWPDELVGLEVRSPDGVRLGEVVDVVVSQPQSRLVIRTGGGVVEVPFVVELVPELRTGDGYVIVEPLPGLFD